MYLPWLQVSKPNNKEILFKNQRNTYELDSRIKKTDSLSYYKHLKETGLKLDIKKAFKKIFQSIENGPSESNLKDLKFVERKLELRWYIFWMA